MTISETECIQSSGLISYVLFSLNVRHQNTTCSKTYNNPSIGENIIIHYLSNDFNVWRLTEENVTYLNIMSAAGVVSAGHRSLGRFGMSPVMEWALAGASFGACVNSGRTSCTTEHCIKSIFLGCFTRFTLRRWKGYQYTDYIIDVSR